MGRDSCPYTGCILRVAKCDTGRKRSNSRVREKNSQLQQSVIQPCLLPSGHGDIGALADDALVFLAEIGWRATLCTADPRETTFLYQRISLAIQRFNAVFLAELVDCFGAHIIAIPDILLHFDSFRGPGNEVPVH